jgi:hypothetical protein
VHSHQRLDRDSTGQEYPDLHASDYIVRTRAICQHVHNVQGAYELPISDHTLTPTYHTPPTKK